MDGGGSFASSPVDGHTLTVFILNSRFRPFRRVLGVDSIYIQLDSSVPSTQPHPSPPKKPGDFTPPGGRKQRSADLAVSVNDEFARRQCLQTHGASGMEFLRGNPDFRPEPELVAVGEPGAGVDVNRSAVHLVQEFLCIVVILRDDGLRVSRGIPVDVADGFLLTPSMAFFSYARLMRSFAASASSWVIMPCASSDATISISRFLARAVRAADPCDGFADSGIYSSAYFLFR